MTRHYSFIPSLRAGHRIRTQRRALMAVFTLAICFAALATVRAAAQEVLTGEEKVIHGYAVHQSIELGGHIADRSGSGAMWDNLVNLGSGPRLLNQSLTLHSIDPGKTPFFDDLSTNSFGYGGDPNSTSMLRVSKGKLYQLDGNFRRDRQYFDYNLLANPLIPSTAFPFVPVMDSPHLFNTVRRMTDLDLTILPLSVVSLRFGYSKNYMEGPTFSSIHSATDVLLSQWWRNNNDTFTGGVDWKPTHQTTFSYDQFVTQYKGDTTWKLTGLNYQITDGTPVSLGLDIFTGPAANSTCVVLATASNATPTIRPNCSGTLSYQRYSPTRVLFPTEQVRFASSEFKNVTMNGRLLYSGSTGSINQFNESFTGWLSRTGQSQILDAGAGSNGKFASLKRVSVAGDYGITVKITPEIFISDTFDFNAFRSPASNNYLESSVYAPSLASKSPTTPFYSASSGADSTLNQNSNFLGQNTKGNTISAAWDPAAKFNISLGYRYRDREITLSSANTLVSNYNPRSVLNTASGCPNNTTACSVTVVTPAAADTTSIHEHWGLLGFYLQPTDKLRIHANVDAMYADNTFVEISPRQIQHYRFRTTYKAAPWMNLSGTINLFENRNNVDQVHYRAHARDYSFGASISKSEKWAVDLSYAYDDVFARTDQCYIVSAVAALGVTVPNGLPACTDPDKLANGLLFYNPMNYDEPTQFGSISLMLAPVKRVHANLGYRMTAVDGHEVRMDPRAVPGSLQSQYQLPYGDVAFNLAPGWSWKAAWNYYGFGEGTPIGPTAARSFRGNVYTLGVKYAF